MPEINTVQRGSKEKKHGSLIGVDRQHLLHLPVSTFLLTYSSSSSRLHICLLDIWKFPTFCFCICFLILMIHFCLFTSHSALYTTSHTPCPLTPPARKIVCNRTETWHFLGGIKDWFRVSGSFHGFSLDRILVWIKQGSVNTSIGFSRAWLDFFILYDFLGFWPVKS